MRLCYNDGFGGPLGKIKREDAAFYREIGFGVVGLNVGDADAVDADIEHAKRVLEEYGLAPGPYGAGRTTFRPDEETCRRQKDELKRVLRIAGAMGCPTIRISGGSYHPANVWMHHPENITQKALDTFIEHTKELVPFAEKHRVAICPETTQFTIINGIDRMCEFVDRCDSPYVKIVFDPVNHMTADRVYDSGRFMQKAIATLDERIGVIHVKDVMVQDSHLVVHIDEAPMGTGLLDHAALIESTVLLEPWKTFSLEHIRGRNLIRSAYDHIQSVAKRIGHTWSDPACSRERFEKGLCK